MAEIRKRVILLRHTHPPLITGVFDPSVHNIREFVEMTGEQGQKIEASLFKVTPRVIYYREIMEPPKTGKLGQFHPQQR